MEVKGRRGSSSSVLSQSEEEMELRRGPWTVEEDITLINYIANHGEGRWNSLARCAGLKRTGKSCRLRWLNYLRPDVRRGNITLEEQLLILELHSRWGNRWSKIAQHLPGRTDNEIKNYWRTRVQKHAKQLKCDVNSKQFKDTMRYLWMPRLVERIQAASSTSTATTTNTNPSPSFIGSTNSTARLNFTNNVNIVDFQHTEQCHLVLPPQMTVVPGNDLGNTSAQVTQISYTSDNSSESFGNQVSPVSDLTHDYYYYNNNNQVNNNPNLDMIQAGQVNYQECLTSPPPSVCINQEVELEDMEQINYQWLLDGTVDTTDNLWTVDDVWFFQQQLNNNTV